MKCLDIFIKNENHTLGNLLANTLKVNSEVDFAAYKMPHPLKEKIVLRLKIKNNDKMDEEHHLNEVRRILRDSIINRIEELVKMKNEWKELTGAKAHFYDKDLSTKYEHLETIDSVYL